jgi:hypothetical protein
VSWKRSTPTLHDTNRTYQRVRREHGCGEFELASRAVAVPFVGATAASVTIAEALRAVLGGVRIGSALVRMSTPDESVFREVDDGYEARRAPLIAAQPAASLSQ